MYHITVVTHGRVPLFQNHRAAWAVCRCLHDPSALARPRLLAWVLMPDHAHWLIQLGPDGGLDRAVCRLKSASARSINRELGRSGRVWATGYHDRALRREDDLVSVARYIVANPLRAGLVTDVGQYPYWNAVWL